MLPLLHLFDLIQHRLPGSLTQTQNKNQTSRSEIPAPLMSVGLLALTATDPASLLAARHELFSISFLSNAAEPFFSMTIKPSYGVNRSPEWGMSKLLGKIGVISRKLFRSMCGYLP